jgi:hypothetical protein
VRETIDEGCICTRRARVKAATLGTSDWCDRGKQFINRLEDHEMTPMRGRED